MLHLVCSVKKKSPGPLWEEVFHHSPRLKQQPGRPQGAFMLTAHFQAGNDLLQIFEEICKMNVLQERTFATLEHVVKYPFNNPQTVHGYSL